MNNELTDNQSRCIDFISQKKKVFLIGLTGAGKTRTIATFLQTVTDKKVLICSTKNIIMLTWVDELDKFGLNYNNYSALLTPAQKKPHDESIYLCNFERVHYLESGLNFDIIILDESSLMKNPDGVRASSLLKLTKNAEYVICMSGTPVPNTSSDFFGQLVFLGVDLPAKNLTEYRNKFMIDRGKKRAYSIWKDKANNFDMLFQLSKDRIFFLPKLIDVPIHISGVRVPLSNGVQTLYDDILRTSKYDNVSLTRDIAREKANQILQGGVYHPKTSTYIHIHNERVNAVAKYVFELGRNCIVAYSYDFEKELYEKALNCKAGLFFDEWNNKEKRIMIVNCASVSHGLNLQFGGYDIVWTCPIFNFETFYQANSRLARKGQENEKVYVHLFYSRYTVQDDRLKSLGDKDIAHKKFIEHAKNNLPEVFEALKINA